MTPLDPSVVRESFALIRSVSPELVHEIIDSLEKRLLLDEAMIALRARLDETCDEIAFGADVVPLFGHSVRVPDGIAG